MKYAPLAIYFFAAALNSYEPYQNKVDRIDLRDYRPASPIFLADGEDDEGGGKDGDDEEDEQLPAFVVNKLDLEKRIV